MFRKIHVLSLGLAAICGVTFGVSTLSAGSYGMAGCGFGSVLIQQNNILQIFAATTNDIYSTNTSAITSGTSNCTPNSAAYIQQQQEVFVTVNYSALEREIASGSGEKLDAFASLLGCQGQGAKAFSTAMQKKHSAIFTKDRTPSELLVAVKGQISGDASLAKMCKL
ncbi:MAG: DUF3015 family protein [Spirochaetia bacterium]|nr:DUF3015 family protein [Spirochaetia bacterium]